MTNEILVIIGILLAAAAALMVIFYGDGAYALSNVNRHHIGWDPSLPLTIKGLT